MRFLPAAILILGGLYGLYLAWDALRIGSFAVQLYVGGYFTASIIGAVLMLLKKKLGYVLAVLLLALQVLQFQLAGFVHEFSYFLSLTVGFDVDLNIFLGARFGHVSATFGESGVTSPDWVALNFGPLVLLLLLAFDRYAPWADAERMSPRQDS